MCKSMLLTAGFIGALGAGQAMAQSDAMATSDLYLRAGPGTAFAAVGVIPSNQIVRIESCDTASNWCQVAFSGQVGWAHGGYLSTLTSNDVVVMVPPTQRQVTTTVTEDTRDRSAAVVGTMGALAGAAAAGPVGAAVGLVGGAATGGLADPGPQVTTYVTENPVAPVYLEGDIVTGAYLPETVPLYRVPQSRYDYAYINGVPVLVIADKRQIVWFPQ